MKGFKRNAPMVALFGGIAVFSSGCTLSDVSLILQILKLLGIV